MAALKYICTGHGVRSSRLVVAVLGLFCVGGTHGKVLDHTVVSGLKMTCSSIISHRRLVKLCASDLRAGPTLRGSGGIELRWQGSGCVSPLPRVTLRPVFCRRIPLLLMGERKGITKRIREGGCGCNIP